MPILTVTAKGQVTLRKDVLEHLGVRPGDKIMVDKRPNGAVEVKAVRLKGAISDVFDMFKREGGPSFTIDELNDIIAGSWAGER